jgi:hypothetical protein
MRELRVTPDPTAADDPTEEPSAHQRSESSPSARRLAGGARGGWIRLILDPATAATQGTPLLDPRSWTSRHRIAACLGLLVATIAGLVRAVQAGAQTGATEGVRAFFAAGIAVGLVWLAASLRGITLPGFICGGLFITAGILSWAYTDTPLVVWALLGIEGVLFAIWTFPWLRDLRQLPRLGSGWLGLSYWFLGIIGAVLVLHPKVAVQRIAYTGLFTLGALAVVVATRKSRKDLTVGIVAAFLVAMAAVFLLGSGNAFDDVHVVPDNAWGLHMENRFWGGSGLLYHPNSIALVVVIIAVRIAADATFERWQRYAALAATTITLVLVDSRTGWLYFGAAAGLHALLVWRRWRRRSAPPADGLDSYPSGKAALASALVPLALTFVIMLGCGGMAFLTADRYDNQGDPTSGRTQTWAQVFREFKADDVAEKLFGDAKYARAYIVRDDAVKRPGVKPPNLTIDNDPISALRHGGILGELAFWFGFGLIAWHSIKGAGSPNGKRVTPPAWFTISVIGSIATMATAEWLLGGTGGTLWIFLVGAEAYILSVAARPVDSPVGN